MDSLKHRLIKHRDLVTEFEYLRHLLLECYLNLGVSYSTF